jgi:septal ring factor EnvC (AmiA/AmiB activator)
MIGLVAAAAVVAVLCALPLLCGFARRFRSARRLEAVRLRVEEVRAELSAVRQDLAEVPQAIVGARFELTRLSRRLRESTEAEIRSLYEQRGRASDTLRAARERNAHLAARLRGLMDEERFLEAEAERLTTVIRSAGGTAATRPAAAGAGGLHTSQSPDLELRGV